MYVVYNVVTGIELAKFATRMLAKQFAAHNALWAVKEI